MVLEIRKIVAKNLPLGTIEDIGVIRGDNVTFIVTRHGDLLDRTKVRILEELSVAFEDNYIHLGLIRFI